MADKRLQFEIGADIGPASKALDQLQRDAKKRMGEVGDAIEDAGDESRLFIDALKAMRQGTEDELRQAAEAADALGRALGPELGDKIKQADVDKFVADLRTKMGADFDAIKANAQELATELKSMNDINTSDVSQRFQGLRGDVDNVGFAADNSRSVMANFTGNVASELPGVAGAFGPLNMAIGQFTEYATEGNIKLGNLVKLVGPMALITGATLGLSAALNATAETKAFHRDRVREFTDALEDAVVSAEELRDVLADDSGAGIMVRLFNETINAERAVADAFDTFGEFRSVIEGGQPAFSEWASTQLAAAEAAGASSQEIKLLSEVMAGAVDPTRNTDDAMIALKGRFDDTILVALALGQAITQQGIATDDAAFKARFYGDALGETKTATENAATATGASERAIQLYNERVEEGVDVLREQADALSAQAQAMMNAADASIAAEDAQQNFIDAVEASNEVNADAEATSDDKAAAVRAERDAMRDAANAAVRLAEEQAAANGTTLTGTQRVDAFNTSLTQNARFATPAAQRAIYEYIVEANGIPESKATEILTLVDQGQLDAANWMIADVSRSRTSQIRADALTGQAEGELNNAARDRTAFINTYLRKAGDGVVWTSSSGQKVYVYDRGTPSAPNAGVAAERRPEFVDGMLVTSPTMVGAGSKITGGAETEQILRAAANGGGGPVTINVSVVAPFGNNPSDFAHRVSQAIALEVRRNGSGWLRRLVA